MNAFILVTYLVLNGQMVKHTHEPYVDAWTCNRDAMFFMAAKPDGDKFKPLFAECVAKSPSKSKPKVKAMT